MALSDSEKQILIGSLVVGCLLGAFVVYAVFALASEFRLQQCESMDIWQTAAEAVFALLVAVTLTIGLLGVLPIAVRRWRAKGGDSV